MKINIIKRIAYRWRLDEITDYETVNNMQIIEKIDKESLLDNFRHLVPTCCHIKMIKSDS